MSLRTTGIAIVFIFVLGLVAAYFCLNISPPREKHLRCDFHDSHGTASHGMRLFASVPLRSQYGVWPVLDRCRLPSDFQPRGMRYCGCGGGVPAHVSKRFGCIRELGREYARRGAHIGVEQREDFRSLDAAALMEQHCRGRRAFVRACARRIRRYSVPRWQLSGVTRTIPIAIYFEWMNGNDSVAWFWTAVIIAFSFVVICSSTYGAAELRNTVNARGIKHGCFDTAACGVASAVIVGHGMSARKAWL